MALGPGGEEGAFDEGERDVEGVEGGEFGGFCERPGASTAVTSNVKLSAWGKYLGDTTLVAAILDRPAANSIRIDIDGLSYRQHLALRRAKAPGLEPPTAAEQS